MQPIFDIIDPADGVIIQERAKIKAGKSLDERNRSLNKMSRTEYMNQSHYREFTIEHSDGIN